MGHYDGSKVGQEQGGCSDISNLQTLCSRSNAGQCKTEIPGFRGLQASEAPREAGCVHCVVEGGGRDLLTNKLARFIADACRLNACHRLAIPRRQVDFGPGPNKPGSSAFLGGRTEAGTTKANTLCSGTAAIRHHC